MSNQTATKPTVVIESSPKSILDQLTKHASANPFATDRKSVMVAAKGRALIEALAKVQDLRAAADAQEAALAPLCAEAIAVLNGTHPGLTTGVTGAKGVK